MQMLGPAHALLCRAYHKVFILVSKFSYWYQSVPIGVLGLIAPIPIFPSQSHAHTQGQVNMHHRPGMMFSLAEVQERGSSTQRAVYSNHKQCLSLLVRLYSLGTLVITGCASGCSSRLKRALGSIWFRRFHPRGVGVFLNMGPASARIKQCMQQLFWPCIVEKMNLLGMLRQGRHRQDLQTTTAVPVVPVCTVPSPIRS